MSIEISQLLNLLHTDSDESLEILNKLLLAADARGGVLPSLPPSRSNTMAALTPPVNKTIRTLGGAGSNGPPTMKNLSSPVPPSNVAETTSAPPGPMQRGREIMHHL
jgi:hypothetical protein